jgi:branched-chain amino acid transport system permease protein
VGYYQYVGALFGIYATLAVSLNLLVGFSGLFTLVHAGFAGIGGYVASILLLRTDVSWLAATGLALLVAAVVSSIFGIITLRLGDVYYVVGTFALQVILYNVFLNWADLTGGSLGLPGIPRPQIGSVEIGDGRDYLIFSLASLVVTFSIVWRLVHSPYGRVLRAIREDEMLARVLGKNVAAVKVLTFVIAAVLAAWSGVMLASLLTFIDPSVYDLDFTVFLLAIVILGGTGNLWGSVVGAVVLTLLPEILTHWEIGGIHAPQLRILLYGAVLMIVIRLRPLGLIPEYGGWPSLTFLRRRAPQPLPEGRDGE